jgi:hypothetical protein
MQTRSKTQKEIEANELSIQEIIDSFDEAHLGWIANKKKGANGTYSYIVEKKSKRNSGKK